MAEKKGTAQLVEMHAIITGHVQGVCFRATTYRHATRMDVVGTVKNLSDGTVELYAQGEKERLMLLIEGLKENPGAGAVESVDLDFYPLKAKYDSFNIIY